MNSTFGVFCSQNRAAQKISDKSASISDIVIFLFAVTSCTDLGSGNISVYGRSFYYRYKSLKRRDQIARKIKIKIS